MPCHKAEARSSLQDTFETSLCTNQLYPTVDCPERYSPTPQASSHRQHANDAAQRSEAEALSSLQDNRAVGNSRLAHRDVLSVS